MKPNAFKSGYTLVFGGPSFRPEDFLQASALKPDGIVHCGDALSDGSVAADSWVEWSDIHEGTYPLDVAGEAVDFLEHNRDEFLRLACFPGVTFRTLNIFGDADTCCLEIGPSAIALFHALTLHVSVSPHASASAQTGEA